MYVQMQKVTCDMMYDEKAPRGRFELPGHWVPPAFKAGAVIRA